MRSIPGISVVNGLSRFASAGPKRAAATLAGAGAAVGVGVYALVKKRKAGEERSAYEPPAAAPGAADAGVSEPAPSESAAEPAIGGPDAEAAREIAAEPTAPADVPEPPGDGIPSSPAEPVNKAMEEIAGEPSSPSDVPGVAPSSPADVPGAAPLQPITEPPPAADKPSRPTGTDAPSNPAVEPGNHAADAEPHHALNTPVGDPDPTEWPDPYEQREDPRDPAGADVRSVGDEPHVPNNAESTSEPPPSQDPEAGERATPPKRDKLDG